MVTFSIWYKQDVVEEFEYQVKDLLKSADGIMEEYIELNQKCNENYHVANDTVTLSNIQRIDVNVNPSCK